ncbi:hypothetical protein FOZ62_015110 [Perkinsus olseni]|uniref:Uncharacterized protein n=1 Tax=Perkinsus olseni TaxID=32597 RepID=A0A7J6TN84_PEROL|nr:hypothetical protein FOZ62_015110 [Perkinsus olseni]
MVSHDHTCRGLPDRWRNDLSFHKVPPCCQTQLMYVLSGAEPPSIKALDSPTVVSSVGAVEPSVLGTAPAVDLHEQDHSGTSDLPSGRGNQGWRDLFDNRVHGKSMPKAQISEHKVSNGLPERNRPGRALD